MDEIAGDVRTIRDNMLMQQGAWKAFLGLAIVMSTVAVFFGIASWFGFGAQ